MRAGMQSIRPPGVACHGVNCTWSSGGCSLCMSFNAAGWRQSDGHNLAAAGGDRQPLAVGRERRAEIRLRARRQAQRAPWGNQSES